MPEFEYRGYRVRTVFEKTWQIRVWPPLAPAKLVKRIHSSKIEGEAACRTRARAAIDAVLERQKTPGKPALQ